LALGLAIAAIGLGFPAAVGAGTGPEANVYGFLFSGADF
jgi:hypothetical protein